MSKRKAPSSPSASRASNELRTPISIKMSPGLKRSECLSPELQTLRAEIFNSLPQNPHFSPLQKYCTSVRSGLKIGLDVAFIKLVQKIQNLVDPSEFLADSEEYVSQFTQLEEMGYDVSKLRGRFDKLRKIAEQDKILRGKIENDGIELEDEKLKVEATQSRILELETEINKLKDGLKTQKSQVDYFRSRLMKTRGDSDMVLGEFASVAQGSGRGKGNGGGGGRVSGVSGIAGVGRGDVVGGNDGVGRADVVSGVGVGRGNGRGRRSSNPLSHTIQQSQPLTQTTQQSQPQITQITQQSERSEGSSNKKQKFTPVRRSGRIGFRSNPSLNGKTFDIDSD